MRARRSWPSRFNWASTSRSRKHPEFSPARGCRTWLQLGLDLAVEETMLPALLALTTEALQLGLDLAVEETGTLEYLRKVGAVASIGPRPRGRGNEGMQAHSSSSLPSLQLGLDLAVEETRDGRARRDR